MRHSYISEYNDEIFTVEPAVADAAGITDQSVCWGVVVYGRTKVLLPPSRDCDEQIDPDVQLPNIVVSPIHPDLWLTAFTLTVPIPRTPKAICNLTATLDKNDINLLVSKCSLSGYSTNIFESICELTRLSELAKESLADARTSARTKYNYLDSGAKYTKIDKLYQLKLRQFGQLAVLYQSVVMRNLLKVQSDFVESDRTQYPQGEDLAPVSEDSMVSRRIWKYKYSPWFQGTESALDDHYFDLLIKEYNKSFRSDYYSDIGMTQDLNKNRFAKTAYHYAASVANLYTRMQDCCKQCPIGWEEGVLPEGTLVNVIKKCTRSGSIEHELAKLHMWTHLISHWTKPFSMRYCRELAYARMWAHHECEPFSFWRDGNKLYPISSSQIDLPSSEHRTPCHGLRTSINRILSNGGGGNTSEEIKKTGCKAFVTINPSEHYLRLRILRKDFISNHLYSLSLEYTCNQVMGEHVHAAEAGDHRSTKALTQGLLHAVLKVCEQHDVSLETLTSSPVAAARDKKSGRITLLIKVGKNCSPELREKSNTQRARIIKTACLTHIQEFASNNPGNLNFSEDSLKCEPAS